MDNNNRFKVWLVLAVGMLVIAGSLLFSVKASTILFSYLPKTEGGLIVAHK